jgi:hypothetical protein
MIYSMFFNTYIQISFIEAYYVMIYLYSNNKSAVILLNKLIILMLMLLF